MRWKKRHKYLSTSRARPALLSAAIRALCLARSDAPALPPRLAALNPTYNAAATAINTYAFVIHAGVPAA